ncbi:uncharacterized protein LOC142233772 [Haematobia irritans]|uniref:uncharacterized protein LOC142233772 n=1 Tax=Haematobia irritans TaxID=7368 RepID=UPI003F4FC937
MHSFIVLCFVAVACAQSGYNYHAAGGSAGGSSGGHSHSHGEHGASHNAPAQAVLEKEFYTFTADEQDFNEPAIDNQVSNSFRQGLRVIFIKGPDTSGSERAALSLAKHASQQKTIIYVLNKQADLASLSNQLKTENSHVNAKPEVHFVKYRTEEDANNARRTIEAEYESLGGRTQHINGGVAKSLNFASKASGGHSDASHSAPSDTYLPVV